MTKKALLVDINVCVRTVVDIPDDVNLNHYFNTPEGFDSISKSAIGRFRKNVMEDKDYPYPENIGLIEEDLEIPYGEAPEDK